jgi:hypothetical protein
MLSGLRLLLGGFCAALAVLAALAVVATSRSYVSPAGALPARGALMEPADHPEWRQFLVLAALRRADEVNRLRDLPDSMFGDKPEPSVANLPGGGIDSAPDDETGSVTDSPSVTIPIDIGVTSAPELPVVRAKEPAQVQRLPALAEPAKERVKERAKPVRAKVQRSKPVAQPVAQPVKSVRKQRVRRAKPPQQPATVTNPFQFWFTPGTAAN